MLASEFLYKPGVVLFYIYYLIIKLVMKIVIVNYEKVIESKAI